MSTEREKMMDIDYACHVAGELAGHPRAGVKLETLAERLGLSERQAAETLTTLRRQGYVELTVTGQHRLTGPGLRAYMASDEG